MDVPSTLASAAETAARLQGFVLEGSRTRVWAQSIGKWCVANSVINLSRLGFVACRRLRAALEDSRVLANQKQDGLDKTNVLHLLFQTLRADLQNGHLYNLHAKKLKKAKHRGGLGKLAFLLADCPADEGDNVGYLLVYGNHCVAVSRHKGCYFPSDPRVGKKRRALALKPGLFEALQIQEEDVQCVIRLESKAAAPRASKRARSRGGEAGGTGRKDIDGIFFRRKKIATKPTRVVLCETDEERTKQRAPASEPSRLRERSKNQYHGINGAWLLVDHTAVDRTDEDGIPSLLQTARRGRLDVVRLLVDHTAVDRTAGDGVPSLPRTARRGRLDVVRRLVDHHAAVDLAKQGGGQW